MPGDHPSRQLGQLLAFPREELNIELKGWLDLATELGRANLAKATLALANSGGGFIVIGFTESEGHWIAAEDRPDSLAAFGQDRVNDIIRRYAEPTFHCDVNHVPHPETGELYPVIAVPGNQRVPIRSKSEDPERKHVRLNTYYIRRPGPSSDQPQNAREWDALIRRCMLASRDELLDAFRQIVYGPGAIAAPPAEENFRTKLKKWEHSARERWCSLVATDLADEKPSRYEQGVWTASYGLFGSFEHPDLKQLLSVLQEVQGHETGWPPWWIATRDEIAPYPYHGMVECWMRESRFEDGAHSDFWRASPDGMLFLVRGHQEDAESEFSEGEFSPGRVLVVTSPIWEVGQVLLHLERYAHALAASPVNAVVRFRWEGLRHRVLGSWPGRVYNVPNYRCRQEAVESEIELRTDRIKDALPELVADLTAPLYQAFDFFKAPLRMVQREIAEMRSSRM